MHKVYRQLKKPTGEVVEGDIWYQTKGAALPVGRMYDGNEWSKDKFDKRAQGIRVSKSKSVYINSEGLSFNELHTIASRLNKLAYDDGLDVTLKLEG